MSAMASQKLVKRFDAYRRKHGDCATCVHRDREEMHHGRAHCPGNWRRQHPTCVTDGKAPRYAVDVDVVNGFREQGE